MELYATMMVYNERIYLSPLMDKLLTFCDGLVVMDNGSRDGGREFIADQACMNDGRVTGVLNWQGDPLDYSFERNKLLAFVPDGAWVLQWDADEWPSDGLAEGIRAFLEEDNDAHTGWTLPIFHLMHDPQTVLGFEVGFGKLRLYRKEPHVRYNGAIHEQVFLGDPWGGIGPQSGMAVVHFSYFATNRFRRKAMHYASIPGSGFLSPEDLLCRLNWPTVPLPPQVTYTIDHDHLKDIRYAD